MQHAALTKNAPDKPRNGECFLIKKHVSGTVILVMAAGSVTDPCDWKASETAVKTISECIDYEADLSKSAVTGWIKKAAKAVNEIHGICAGAKTGLALALIQTDGNGWLVNIGQILAMKWSDSRLEELVTGQSVDLLGEQLKTVKMIPVQLEKSDGLVLISQGVEKHPSRNYLKDFTYLFSKPDPDKNLPLLMAHYSTGQERDITAMVLTF